MRKEKDFLLPHPSIRERKERERKRETNIRFQILPEMRGKKSWKKGVFLAPGRKRKKKRGKGGKGKTVIKSVLKQEKEKRGLRGRGKGRFFLLEGGGGKFQ